MHLTAKSPATLSKRRACSVNTAGADSAASTMAPARGRNLQALLSRAAAVDDFACARHSPAHSRKHLEKGQKKSPLRGRLLLTDMHDRRCPAFLSCVRATLFQCMRTYERTWHYSGKLLVVILSELRAVMQQIVCGLQIKRLLDLGIRREEYVKDDDR